MSADLAVLEMSALLRSGASANLARGQFQIQELSTFQQKQFGFIWKVSARSGGNLALALDRLAQVFDAQQKALSELKIAFASPKATANLILLLPFMAIVLSELMGLKTFAALFGSSLGAFSFGIGIILLIVARVLSLRMLAKSRPREADPGAFLDAVVVGLSAGLSPKSAGALATSSALEELGEKVTAEQLGVFWDALKISEQAGIALSGILSARADALRHKLWNRRRAELSRLSVSLMIPLGLLALPAFVLLAVVPMGIGLFNS